MSNGMEVHEYLPFTGKQRRDTALHHLEGIFNGISLDNLIAPREVIELRDWAYSQERLGDKDSAIREVLERVRAAVADSKLDHEELEDLKSLCRRAKSDSVYYQCVTHAVQELHGILHGIVSDLVVSVAELRGLQTWLDDNAIFRGTWPITEVESLVVKVLGDGRIDEAEQRFLLRYFSEFAPSMQIERKIPPLLPTELTVTGVCAVDPELFFDEKVFSFTGVSSKGPRRLFADIVAKKKGLFIDHIRDQLDYLVIGDEGNPCWAFACYGRKVERVVEMRRSGHHVLLVHERDFWDAIG